MVNMGNVWDRTTAFIGDHIGGVATIALLAILLPTTIGNVLWGAAQQCDGSVNPLVATIVSLLFALVTLWAQLALSGLVLTQGDRAAAQRTATAGFGRAVAAMLVLFVVIVVAALPLVFAISSSGSAMMQPACGAATATAGKAPNIFVPIYGAILALVGAYVSVRVTMLYPVVVAERIGIGAIGRSFRLSRGIVWKLIGVWLVFLIVYGIASAATGSAFGAIFRLLAPNAGPFAVTTILLAVLVAAVRTAFTVIVATFAAQLYLEVTKADTERLAA
jgi:hypothetical protein